MVEIREPGGEGNLSGPSLVRAARDCRPRPRPGAAVLSAGGGHLVWPAGEGPSLILSLWAPVWSALDGSLSGDELIDDLQAVLGCPVEEAEQEVTRFLHKLHDGALADGLDPLHDELARLQGHDAGAGRARQYEDETDGIRYLVTEVDISLRELQQMTGGKASRAELVPPDSCLGERLHLHRPAAVRTVEVGGELVSVRSVDPDRVAWLEDEAAHRPGEKGPVVAFVTAGPGGAGRTRWEVYDAGGVLTASTTDAQVVALSIAGLAGPPGGGPVPPGYHRARLRAVVKGDRAVVAPLWATERPRGMLRQLERRGAHVAPTAEVALAADGSSVHVPEPVLGGPFSGHRRFGTFALAGLWGAANRKQEANEVEVVSLLVRDTEGGTAKERQGLMEATLNAVRRRPLALSYRGERSSLTLATRMADLFDA